jgi:hypothetical protein
MSGPNGRHKPKSHFARASVCVHIRGCIQKFPDWVYNEINNNNKHSLWSNTKGYGGRTHKIAIQLHLVAESCTICSSRSRQPLCVYVRTYVRGCIQKFLDWPPRARTTATRCSCIVILWVSLVSFAAITLCVASQLVIPNVRVYFVIYSVRKLLGKFLDKPSYTYVWNNMKIRRIQRSKSHLRPYYRM